MGLRFKDQNLANCFFVTTSFTGREPLGNLPGVYEALVLGIRFQVNETGAKLAAYVLMPSHRHLLLFIDGKQLSAFMRDFKKYTAQKALLEICGGRRIWQSRFDRQAVWSEKKFLAKINY